MARASVETRTVPRPVTERVTVLELSEAEVQVLNVILNRVGGGTGKYGTPATGRVHASSVLDALRAAGVVNKGSGADERLWPVDESAPSGALYFKAAT